MTVSSVYSEITKGEPRNHLNNDVGEYETRVSYHNRTGRPIRVSHRNGISYVLESEAVTGFRVFLVQVELCMSKNVRDQLVNLLNSANHLGDKNLYFMKRMVEEFGIRQVGLRYYLNMEYRTQLDDINARGVYVKDADILLTDGRYEQPFPHPFSEEGLLRKASREMVRLKEYSERGIYKDLMGISFEVIDDSPQAHSRYYRLGLNIVEIKPQPSTDTKHSGLYVYFHGTDDVHYISWDDKENLRLYGVFDTRREAEVSNSELVDIEIKRLKQELEKEQYQHRQSLLKLEKENEAIKLETARRREDMKDYYEERSYQRKDDNEMIKALPALIVGIGGVFMAMKALK